MLVKAVEHSVRFPVNLNMRHLHYFEIPPFSLLKEGLLLSGFLLVCRDFASTPLLSYPVYFKSIGKYNNREPAAATFPLFRLVYYMIASSRLSSGVSGVVSVAQIAFLTVYFRHDSDTRYCAMRFCMTCNLLKNSLYYATAAVILIGLKRPLKMEKITMFPSRYFFVFP